MEGGTGFEPVDGGFADHSVSHFAIRPIFKLRCAQKLVYQFYPVSASAYQGISANKKRYLYGQRCLKLNGAEDEIRTRDPRLGKAMLYH
jgi:hypothetical protein